jgi:hypothetical protein
LKGSYRAARVFADVVVSDGDHAGQEVWGSGPSLGRSGTRRELDRL